MSELMKLFRNQIPTAIPMFLRMKNSNITLQTPCNVSGSQNLIWWPLNRKDLISQLIDGIELKSQQLKTYFPRMSKVWERIKLLA